MKIDSCIIVKNEENNIEQLINQLILFSNEVHVTDTGSTDNTLNILKNLQNIYSNLFIHHFEWVKDFSKAKNYSLTCYDCKADYQFWCDGDDQLNDKLIETLKSFVSENNLDDTIYYIKYQYFDGDTNPHLRTSLFKANFDIYWKDPIHEYIPLKSNYKLNTYFFDNGSLIIHKSTDFNHNGRNLDIFFNMEKTGFQFDGRNRYYYGQELKNNGLVDLATIQFIKCIEYPNGDILDKYNSVIQLFFIDKPMFLKYAYQMLNNGNFRKDIFYYLAEYYLSINNYQLATAYYLTTVNLPEPEPLFSFMYDHKTNVYCYLQLNVIAYYQYNDFQKCLEYNQKVLEIDPENETAKNNINILKDK